MDIQLERIILEITPEAWAAVRRELGVPEDAPKRVATHAWRDHIYERHHLEPPMTADDRRKLRAAKKRAEAAQAAYDEMRRKLEGGESDEVTTGKESNDSPKPSPVDKPKTGTKK